MLISRFTPLLLILCVVQLGLLVPHARADIGAYILVDAKTGAVIEGKNATRKWYPASLTKLMTAYVTFKAIREGKASLSSAVVQSKNSISKPPSKMGFKVGTKFTVDTALKIILVKSANDVSVALGEAIAGSEPNFINMMNAEAKRLGMTNTRFTNPHGLPDNRQVTTARDMAILAMALRRDFPEARKFYNHPGIKFGKKTLRSANREFLLRVPGANGMKTGYICNSGYNVASSVTRNGRTLIGIILGAGSGLERTAFARQLFDGGFRKRGKGNVASLKGNTGAPPADGYCRRNKSPGADMYMARFDMKQKKRAGLLFFKADQSQTKKIDSSGYTLANGKPDWHKILDRTLGPRRIAYQPLKVSLGKPTTAPSNTNSAAKSVSTLPDQEIPTPVSNPIRSAKFQQHKKLKQSLQEKATIEAAKQGGDEPTDRSEPAETTAPGSIFRKGSNFTVPFPEPSPK